MRVFVIGGTGFLGTHLIPKLQKEGQEVTVLTRSEEKAYDFENLGDVTPRNGTSYNLVKRWFRIA